MSVDPSSCEISECAGVPWYKVGKLGWCGEHKAEAYKAAADSVGASEKPSKGREFYDDKGRYRYVRDLYKRP